jgi:tetratricopeptide (TPR) repeat protein
LFNKNTGDAVPYLLKSLKINGKNPDASYNLSFTYYQTKDYNNAVKYSLMSFENYADNFYKGDALRITANSYINLGDYGNALSCFDKAIGFNPKDYFSYDGKLNVFLKQKKYDDALSLCEAAFTAMPDYPEVTGFINRTYLQIKRYDDLEKFYADMLPKFENNDAASGNLKLYLGIYYSKMNRKEEARKAFNDSRERFRKVYKENHEVFGVINQWLKSLD